MHSDAARTPETGTNAPQGGRHYAWKGDAASTTTKRERAQRRYALGPCTRCGRAAHDRHHHDGDTGNNAPENVEILCRRCHMLEDGRLAVFRANGAAARVRKSARAAEPHHCSVCADPMPIGKRFRGVCHACNEYRRRHDGADRTPEMIERTRARRLYSTLAR